MTGLVTNDPMLAPPTLRRSVGVAQDEDALVNTVVNTTPPRTTLTQDQIDDPEFSEAFYRTFFRQQNRYWDAHAHSLERCLNDIRRTRTED